MNLFHRRHTRGRPPHPDVLTPAEWRVLEQLRQGIPNAEIAERLGVSINTVKTHVSNMLAKLELDDRGALAAWSGDPAEVSRRALRGVPALLAPLRWAQRSAQALATPAKIVAVGVGTVAFAGVLWIALGGAQGEDVLEVAQTASPTPTASPTETTSPTETPTAEPGGGNRLTGIVDLDAAIEAVESHDVAVLGGLLEFVTRECTHELGAGGPPRCADDEEEGAEVQVFPFATCEPEWLRAADVDAAIDEMVAVEPVRVAAFDTPTGYLRVDGEYVVVFAGPDPRLDGATERGVAVGVKDSRIVEIQLACGAGDDGASMIPGSQTNFLLAPPS